VNRDAKAFVEEMSFLFLPALFVLVLAAGLQAVCWFADRADKEQAHRFELEKQHCAVTP
jgi:hypothetical protein